MRCPECDNNVRTIGTLKGTKVKCRHCEHEFETTEDNI